MSPARLAAWSADHLVVSKGFEHERLTRVQALFGM
jgi:hypothetical protein